MMGWFATGTHRCRSTVEAHSLIGRRECVYRERHRFRKNSDISVETSYRPLAEFSYNNSYQESLKMAPFEVLYRHRCCTPLNWIEPGEKVIFAPDLVDEAEATIHRIQNNLKAV
jgi:hypothetical protein